MQLPAHTAQALRSQALPAVSEDITGMSTEIHEYRLGPKEIVIAHFRHWGLSSVVLLFGTGLALVAALSQSPWWWLLVVVFTAIGGGFWFGLVCAFVPPSKRVKILARHDSVTLQCLKENVVFGSEDIVSISEAGSVTSITLATGVVAHIPTRIANGIPFLAKVSEESLKLSPPDKETRKGRWRLL